MIFFMAFCKNYVIFSSLQRIRYTKTNQSINPRRMIFMFNILFTGRLNRKQYICRYFATVIITALAFAAIEYASGVTLDTSAENISKAVNAPVYLVSILASLITLSFDLRRIYDIGMSAKFMLIPIICTIITYIPALEDSTVFYGSSALSFLFLIYLCAAKGMPEANQYEPQP